MIFNGFDSSHIFNAVLPATFSNLFNSLDSTLSLINFSTSRKFQRLLVFGYFQRISRIQDFQGLIQAIADRQIRVFKCAQGVLLGEFKSYIITEVLDFISSATFRPTCHRSSMKSAGQSSFWKRW